MELVLPRYNAHSYFPSKIWGKNSVHNTQQNMVYFFQYSPLSIAVEWSSPMLFLHETFYFYNLAELNMFYLYKSEESPF